MRNLGFHVADFQSGLDLRRSHRQSRRGAGYGHAYKPCGRRLDLECVAMGQEYTPQVSPSYGVSGSHQLKSCGPNQRFRETS